MLRVRVADDCLAFGAKTLRGAVARLSLGIVAVNLDQLGVVDVDHRRHQERQSSTSCGRPWSTGFDSPTGLQRPEGTPTHTPRPSGLPSS